MAFTGLACVLLFAASACSSDTASRVTVPTETWPSSATTTSADAIDEDAAAEAMASEPPATTSAPEAEILDPISLEPPTDAFVMIEAGYNGYQGWCGIRTDSTLACWGGDAAHGVPEGEFVDVSVGGVACAVNADNALMCWSDAWNNDTRLAENAPMVEFSAVSVDEEHACGIRLSDNAIECWGVEADHSFTVEGDFVAVSLGWLHGCGLLGDGSVKCWQQNDPTADLPYELPDETFAHIAAGVDRTCGLTAGGRLMCWTSKTGEVVEPESPDTFTAIDYAADFICGLVADGKPVCMNRSTILLEPDDPMYPPEAAFASIEVDDINACGLDNDGLLTCWGLDY